MGNLTTRKVETAKAGKHSDGGNLYLFVDAKGARRWFFIFTMAGKRPEMSLGQFPDVSLKDARELAAEARRLVRAGVNPIELRRQAKGEAVERPTFGAVADAFIEGRADQWRNAKHKEQWRVTLETYAASLRTRPVDRIDTEAVLTVLKPLWLPKPETARRLRGRIESVLEAARANGHRTGENPARWRGHLEHLLPARPKVEQGHHAAMPYEQVPDFMARLRRDENIAARALEFAVLTAARSGEIYGARWSEIDLNTKIWTIPPERMKAGRTHRIPLSDRGVAILERLAETRTCDFVFESPRGRRPLSHVAMAKVLERLGVEDATPHGFRSSFRDWAGNETHFAREIAEAALAHTIGDRAEQAYRRGDALEKRRQLMQAWSDYLDERPVSNVVQFAGRAASQS